MATTVELTVAELRPAKPLNRTGLCRRRHTRALKYWLVVESKFPKIILPDPGSMPTQSDTGGVPEVVLLANVVPSRLYPSHACALLRAPPAALISVLVWGNDTTAAWAAPSA